MHALSLPVLAGLDDSFDSTMAAEAAAGEASRRRLPLRLVIPGPARSEDPRAPWQPVADPVGLLGRVASRLSTRHPDLEVMAEVHLGDLAGFLVDESEWASLVVVGPRHTDGYDRRSGCRITRLVQSRAHCPVLVAEPARDKEVPVGRDLRP
jgi:nucleotide-binding universal stress UspA family protein